MSHALVRFVVATFRLRVSHAQPKGCAYGKPALALLAVLLVSCSSLRAETSATDFEAANRLFEQGRFADAASAYEKLLTNGPASAAVHFNLGNAHFKSGQPGRAIFHYHQALRLAPRDPDIRANLQFVRKSLGVAEEAQPGRQLLRALTPDEWAWLAGAALGAWFLMLALGEALPAKRAAFAWLIKALGAAALFLTALFFAAH
ncbi:MAG: tetratricopeptide repeat protein, partial [Limisphaerales bacterium]